MAWSICKPTNNTWRRKIVPREGYLHIRGACASYTGTLKVHEELRPCASVARQVTGVIPSEKVEPLVVEGLEVKAAVAPQLSVTVGDG
jgi:hypothetical protein